MKNQNTGSLGFTLIELLVVVLIIGILASVALPQYNKAVLKSRAVEAKSMMRAISQARERYYLENGVWPTSFGDLDLSFVNENGSLVSTAYFTTKDWTYHLDADSCPPDWKEKAIYAVWKQGNYNTLNYCNGKVRCMGDDSFCKTIGFTKSVSGACPSSLTCYEE